MHSRGRRVDRRRVAAVAVALLVIAAGGVASLALGRPRYEKRGFVHRIQKGDALYTYDAAWRQEAIYGLGSPGAAVPGPEAMESLRAVLLRRLRCRSVEEIPVEGKAEMEAVRALGYL
jgi:hypothetical protein